MGIANSQRKLIDIHIVEAPKQKNSVYVPLVKMHFDSYFTAVKRCFYTIRVRELSAEDIASHCLNPPTAGAVISAEGGVEGVEGGGGLEVVVGVGGWVNVWHIGSRSRKQEVQEPSS